ncbi:MAG: RNA polymerase factor sigma-54 [Planctomycetes bacterium]|nr:RNA polymerase factor sigma-54 [Planctomycetota bacterium]
MKMEAHLQQRQEMRQQLSQRMIQNLQMLQLPVLDLRELVLTELEQNPTIEEKQESDEPETPAAEVEAPEEQAKRELLEAVEEQWLESERRTRRSDSGEDAEKRLEMLQNEGAKPESLRDHLSNQISLMEIPEEVRPFCLAVIQNIDDNGYLIFTPEEIANSFPEDLKKESMEVLVVKVARALQLIQTMEPRGVGARSLKECLLLQLDEGDALYPLLRHLIENHLEDIGNNRLPKIVKDFCAQPEILEMLGHQGEPNPNEILEEVKGLVAEVQKLQPKPGINFATVPNPRVFPEVLIKAVDGHYEIMLEDSYLPPITVNPKYAEMARDKTLSKEEREFLKRKIESGKMLISAIEQRRSTIQKITAEILKRQGDFFEHGIESLKPLKMQEIADAVGIHVSTVSRAISGKWIETPRGIFPMKFFFASAAPKGDTKMIFPGAGPAEPQDEKTRLSLMERIREVVDGEKKTEPLSDLEIAKILKNQHGVAAARRTIAKYREEMGIPSSRIRKQY